MHLLEGGRKAFLEFLRNLTPQIILLSLALVVGNSLNLREFDFSNTPTTILFFALVALGLFGMVANSVNFLSEYCESLGKLDVAVTAKMGEGERTVARLLKITFVEAWRLRKSLAFELGFALVAMNTVILAVGVGAMIQGAGFLRELSGGG